MSVSEYRLKEQTATKFTQVCASQNDLFGLDERGDVYQYNFPAKTWIKLAATRSDDGHLSRAETETPDE